MLWNELFLFDVFINHLPKIHGSVLRKITFDLLYFWEIYDVSLWETNYSKSTANKAEAVFPITYFKAAVIGRRFSKIVVLQCSFFLHLSKPVEMPLTHSILVVYWSVQPVPVNWLLQQQSRWSSYLPRWSQDFLILLTKRN